MKSYLFILFTPNISAGLTLFQAEASDLIIWQLAENWQVAEQSAVLMNLGEMQSEGTEAELKAFFGKYRYAYLNFTWQNVKDTTNVKIRGTSEYQDDFNPGGIPEFYGNIGMNYDFFNEHVIAGLSLNYTGKRERSGEEIWNGKELARADQRDAVKARTLVNASLTFRNFFKGMEIQISGFNLFNADNRSPITFNAGLDNDMPGPGRSFTGRISYPF